MSHLPQIELGSRATVELLSKSKMREQLEFTLVPDAQADFDKGLLGVSTPLAQALLGHTAGETLAYPRGDIVSVHILKVEAVTAAPEQAQDAAEQRDQALKRARDKAELANMVSFALTFDSKWGDYDPEDIVKQYEAGEKKPDDSKPDSPPEK